MVEYRIVIDVDERNYETVREWAREIAADERVAAVQVEQSVDGGETWDMVMVRTDRTDENGVPGQEIERLSDPKRGEAKR